MGNRMQRLYSKGINMKYLNANQKKGLIYMATAGALLNGYRLGLFKLKNGLLRHYLKQVDSLFIDIAQKLSDKEKRQLKRMINSADTDDSNDEFENILQAYFCLDWCIENAFRKSNFVRQLKYARSFLLAYMKYLIKKSYSKNEVINILVKFKEGVEL